MQLNWIELNFAGTLEDYEAAYSKCEVQLARVNERKAKVKKSETKIEQVASDKCAKG
jgi:hypothetical protein